LKIYCPSASRWTTDDKTPMRANETTDHGQCTMGMDADLPVEGNVRVESDPNPFPDAKGFTFGRHDEEFRESTFDLAAATTDSTGRAVISLDPRAAENAQSSRPLRLRAVVSAIEPGGRAVRDDVRVAYRPAERYIGVKPAFEIVLQGRRSGEFRVVSWIAMAPKRDDQLASRTHRLEIRLVSRRWRRLAVAPVATGCRTRSRQSQNCRRPARRDQDTSARLR
jgi:hypothetical protein